jgi:hypothetical protein
MLYDIMLRSVGTRGDDVAALRHLESPRAWLCRTSLAYSSARCHTRITPTISKLASNVQEELVKEILGHNAKVILGTAPKCGPELTIQIQHT